MTLRTLGRGLVVVLVVVTSGACGDDDTTATPTSAARDTTTSAADANGEAEALSTDELRDALGLETLDLDATGRDGMHPVLSWRAVDGAATYWLVVHDTDGQPFWAWSGADTSVRFGGGDRPEANQTAALHESMTWNVMALDAEGSPIALSQEESLAP